MSVTYMWQKYEQCYRSGIQPTSRKEGRDETAKNKTNQSNKVYIMDLQAVPCMPKIECLEYVLQNEFSCT